MSRVATALEAWPWTPGAVRRRPPGPPLAARLAAFTALGLFAERHWMAIVPAHDGHRTLTAIAVAVAAAVALLALRPLRRWARWALAPAVALAAVAFALRAGGVSWHLLEPRHWGALAAGVGQGLAALPNLPIPYTGIDRWARLVIEAGGALTLTLAALVAFWPRRRGAGWPPVALLALVVLYAVPAVVLADAHPYVQGALLFVLIVAFAALERLAARRAPIALGLVALVAVAAALIAPRLDAARPWFDYQSVTAALAPAAATYDWSHRYGPLDWSRDGHEVLRVKAPAPLYWKTVDLNDFDGLRWRTAAGLAVPPQVELPRDAGAYPQWRDQIRVTVRGLRSEQVVGAGTTLAVSHSPRAIDEATSAGTFVAPARLREGDSYLATVYDPRPSAAQLQSAGTSYPSFLLSYTELDLPARGAARPGRRGAEARSAAARHLAPRVQFPLFGVGARPYARVGGPPAGGSPYALQGNGLSAATVIGRSAYARAYALARRLALGARTPYDYVRRVQAYLARGFTYTETPPARPVALESFLFSDRRGYCQQFSGAMALLLRLGGVPARVAAGFAPGTRDRSTGEYVVRDLDAHSWVEAYFPHYGWVTFDPTPAASPARGQLTSNHERASRGLRGAGISAAKLAQLNGIGAAPGGLGTRARVPGGASDWWIAALAGGLGALAVIAALGARRAARRRDGDDRTLADLRRALARSGRTLTAPTTLRELERRFAGVPDAVDYLRAIRARRFAAAAPGPTAIQRRALRGALGAGLGPAGRARAWWAVPPALARRAR